MATALFAEDEASGERALRPGWRLVGVLVLAWALFHAVSLATYSWRDLPVQMAPPSRPAANGLGMAGAWHAYGFLMLFGAAAAWPVLGAAWLGGLMVCGRPLRWRPAGVVLTGVALCGLLQPLRAPLARWSGPEGVNIGGDPGGRLGEWLLDRTLAPWLGGLGSGALLGAVLLAGIVLTVGPRTLAEGYFTWQAFRLERRRRRRDAEALLEEEQEQLGQELQKRNRALEKEEARRRREEARAEAQRAREEDRQTRLTAKEEARRAREQAVREAQERRDALFEAQRLALEKQAEQKRRPAPTPEAPAPEAPPAPTAYRLPDVSLLQAPPPFVPGADNTEEQGRVIVETLEQFGIPVQITDVIRGPVITRYEILPAPGIRVNKITTYSDNLQMALRAVSIRILTPIPGQGVMGLEVPNPKPRIVTIREVAEGAAWRRAASSMALPLLLGKDVGGDDLIVDLAKMPHLLIAGATNSGKSACINSLLSGLLLSRKPDELRLLLVDPKRVEFMPYADLPHLVVPVITDPKKVAISLQWAIAEMNRRLKLFSRIGVRNIADFNTRDHAVQASFLEDDEIVTDPIPERLPYIVILIDEMADLMLVAQAEIENRIARLAQLSRAAGIHLILATQRPSVNIITGTIKANFPGRIAFQVAQKVDSRTILDAGGADALIGRGDMLFLNPSGSNLIRAQGAWVADAEVRRIVACLKEQGRPVYESSIKERLDKVAESEARDEFDEGGSAGEGAAAEEDADSQLLQQALAIIRETRRATTSSIQRRLRIGYNRAARLMDELEQRGYIGPANGSDPREILVDLEGEIPDSEGSG